MGRENKKRQDLINKFVAEKNIAQIPGWAMWDADQAKQYIENNVTDLESAKQVLKKMAQIIIFLRDRN